MDSTANLSLPFLIADQAGKNVTHNEALRLLDAVVQLSVIDRDRIVPPSNDVADGSRHLVAPGAIGDWAGWDGSVALYSGGGWLRLIPKTGWQAFVEAEGVTLTYDGSQWTGPDVLALEGGAATRARVVVSETGPMSGPSMETGLIIPNRAIVLAVAVRTVTDITGAASFDAGLPGEASKFGGSLGVAAGSVNLGVIGPQPFFADTPVILTANGGDFTGGAVRASLHVLEFDAPMA